MTSETSAIVHSSYRDTYYTRSMQAPLGSPNLNEAIDADICIIGGGITGVSSAYELSKKGKSVVLLEADQLAWGASGRNGGLVLPGFAASTSAIEKKVGLRASKEIFDLSVEGMDIFRSYTNELNLPGVEITPGALVVSRYKNAREMRDEAEHMTSQYGYERIYHSTNELRNLINSEQYHDGMMDPVAFHAHSLNYCLGLARETLKIGGRIYENTRAKSMKWNRSHYVIKTEQGSVKCKNVVMCPGGHVDCFNRTLKSTILRVGTFVCVTEKLGPLAEEIIKTQAAIVDTRTSCDYFRITPDGRLLWGAGMSGFAREPANLKDILRKGFTSVFPELRDVKIEASWSGWTGYTRHRMPYLQQIKPNVWAATALGGHGLNTGPVFGRLVAEAIVDGGKRHKVLNHFGLTWNGSLFGPLAADAVYLGSALKDGYQEWRYS